MQDPSLEAAQAAEEAARVERKRKRDLSVQVALDGEHAAALAAFPETEELSEERRPARSDALYRRLSENEVARFGPELVEMLKARRTARSHDGLATANPPARPLAASAVPSTSTSTSTTVAYMYREDAAASASSVISGRSRLRKPTDQFAPAPQVSRRSHTAAQPAVVASPPTQPSLSKAAVLASKSNSSAAVATTSTLRPASCGYPQHTTRSVTRAAIAGAIATTTSAQGSHVTAAAASLPPGLASISAVGAPAADAATAATVDAVMSDSSID